MFSVKHLVVNAKEQTLVFKGYDYLIEDGVRYKYGIQQVKKEGNNITYGALKYNDNTEYIGVERQFDYCYLLGENNHRTRRKKRLAIRGVPRLREAISIAPRGSISMPRMVAERVTIRASSSGVYSSSRRLTPKRSRSGADS